MLHRLFAATLVLAGILSAQGQQPDAKTAPAAAAKPAKPAFIQKDNLYPLGTCVVSGEKLGGDAVAFTAGGRTFQTCCEKCQAKIEKEPAKYTPKLDEALTKVQVAHYPLDTCVVSGQKLGGMGEPVSLVLDGTVVRLCCDKCNKKAEANKAAIVAKVREAAYAQQMKTYPVTTCVVSGEKLGDDSVSVMYGTALVRFCCEKCTAKFEKDPNQYFEKMHPKKDGEKAVEKPSKGDAPAAKPPGEKKEGAAPMAAAVDGECCAEKAAVGAKPKDGASGECCAEKAAVGAKPKDGASGECCAEGAATKAVKPAGEAKPKDAPKIN